MALFQCQLYFPKFRRLLSPKLSSPPDLSVVYICGTRVSRDIRGFRPKRSSKGVMLLGSVGSGSVRLIQQAGETYSSHLFGQAMHNSASMSSIHPPKHSTAPLPRGWFAGLNCMFARNQRKMCLTTSQFDFRTLSTRTTREMPNDTIDGLGFLLVPTSSRRPR